MIQKLLVPTSVSGFGGAERRRFKDNNGTREGREDEVRRKYNYGR